MLNKQGERALVYLANVDAIEPITFLNAEGELEECANIEKLVTGGWNMVVQKGRFEVDQLFVYAECDTILPADIPLFSFLEGKRIKTKKLKGVVSQGVCFTIPEILEVISGNMLPYDFIDFQNKEWSEGDDWTELVGATKYDEYSTSKGGNNSLKQMPQDVRGKFPSSIPKTDEERIQNLAKELKYDWKGKRVVAREKVHGSSITIYAKVDPAHEDLPSRLDFGICSRNFELHLHSHETNNYVKAGLPSLHNLLSHCLASKESIALQGELLGPGINGNPYNLPDFKILFFTAYDINDKYRYTDAELCQLLHILDLDNCPLIDVFELDGEMSSLLEKADAKSALYSKYDREGYVARGVDENFSFKVISNKWLLKEKD
jgi:RNA ligase (TIGR02306 family)